MKCIIYLFYTSQISWGAFIIGLIVFIVLILADKFKVKYTSVFIIGGIVLCVIFLKSGIHATITKLPSQVTKKHLYGASVLGGIGFTMSLFISSLSFSDKTMLSMAKISIIISSILATILGTIILKLIMDSYK